MKPILSLLATIALGLALPVVARAQVPADGPLDRAFAALRAGDHKKAIAEATEVIKLRPDYVDAYLLRSTLRSMTEDNDGALADISKVIELKPDMGSAYYQRATIRLNKDPVGAMKDLNSAVVNNYKTDHVYDVRAGLRMQQGDTKGAIADYDEAIKLNPGNPNLYLSQAELLLTLEDRDRAFADLNYVLTWYETDPTKRPLPKTPIKDDKPVAGQAGLDGAIKGSEEAESKTGKVGVVVETVNASPGDKEMIPNIARAYVSRGMIYSNRGNANAAIADFNKSIRILPTNAWAFFNRALELEGKGDLDGALSDVNKTIELEPKNGNCLVERGLILLLQGKSKEAQVVFDMLLESDPVLWQKRIDERLAEVKKKLPSRTN